MEHEARRDPRVKLEVDIKVYSRATGLLKGRTVDISESGISAILPIGVPIGAFVQLEFKLPLGAVAIRSIVRHQTAFRFGFEFKEPGPSLEIIKRTCQHLYVRETANPNFPQNSQKQN